MLLWRSRVGIRLARLKVVSSNAVEVEFFFSFSFSYINVYNEKVHRNKAFAFLALKKKITETPDLLSDEM